MTDITAATSFNRWRNGLEVDLMITRSRSLHSPMVCCAMEPKRMIFSGLYSSINREAICFKARSSFAWRCLFMPNIIHGCVSAIKRGCNAPSANRAAKASWQLDSLAHCRVRSEKSKSGGHQRPPLFRYDKNCLTYRSATCTTPLWSRFVHSAGKIPSRIVKTSATYMPTVAGPLRRNSVAVSASGSPKYMLTVMRR